MTRPAPGLSEPPADALFEESSTGEPSWVGRDPESGQLLPGFPGPRYSGGARSELARLAKLVEASRPLLERCDTIHRGGDTAISELVKMLTRSVVVLDHFEKEAGARIVLDGPLTGKGRSKAALGTITRLAEQKARLIDKLLPLLQSKPAPTDANFGALLSGLTTEELEIVRPIFERAAERKASGDEPDHLPVVPDETVIELPDELLDD